MIDLRTCKPGDKLLTKHGSVLTYVCYDSDNPNVKDWPHIIRYPNGARGTRTHEGFCFKNIDKRLPSDEDVIEILGADTNESK